MAVTMQDLRPSFIRMVECDVKLLGKTVVITGANTGIGFETALDLTRRGARVIMACRDTGKAEDAKKKILDEIKEANIVTKKLDLASLTSIRKFAEEIYKSEDRLDILINNAGVMLCPPSKTEDGFEMHLGVNHIGHFLLTNLLLELLKKSAPSRIVIVSSIGYVQGTMQWDDIMHENNYNAVLAYAASKLANLLHCKELAERLQGTGVTCYALHPGIVKTDLFRHTEDLSHMSFGWRMVTKMALLFTRLFVYITPTQGSQTTLYCALTPELAKESGKFYTNCAEQTPLDIARNQEHAKRLWDLSVEWTKERQETNTECENDKGKE